MNDFRYLLCGLGFTLLTPGVLAAQSAPTHVDVFVSGTQGYHTFRIPAIETAPDGSLLAFAEARKYNANDPGYGKQDIDLVLRRSTDGGKTWSAMKVIEDPGELWSAANPASVVDRHSKRVWLLYLRCKPERGTERARPGTDDSQILARTSDDNGQTWSAPIDLTAVSREMADAKWRVSVVGPGGMIQDRKGRLLAPVWKFEPFETFAIYSEDHGRTWHRGQMVPGSGDENQLVELADGRLVMDIRQHGGSHRWMSTSGDGGRTWSAQRPGNRVSPIACAIERYTLKSAGEDRDRILWTGPKGPDRQKLVVRVSYDEGQTFSNERLIWDKYAAYSDLAILPDKTVGVLWERGVERGYQFITLTRFGMEFLEPGAAEEKPKEAAKDEVKPRPKKPRSKPEGKKKVAKGRGGEINAPAAKGERKEDQLVVGAPALDFTLPDPEGATEITLSRFRGRMPVVLIFGSFT